MKSEHRHDLQTNDLSANLAKSIESLKPFTGQILTGLVLLAVLYLGMTVWNAQSAQREREAWDAFALATDSSDPEMKGLQRVAGDEQYAGTKMSEWAYVGWADRQVLNAMQYYLIDREKTEDLLRNVSGIYQGFASGASDPQVLNRARFGLARVYELQNKIDEARQQYLTVRGDLQPQAAERSNQLESDEVREACTWLATAELPKRDLTGGQGATGTRPNFEANLPVARPSGDGISAKSLEDLLGDLGNSPTEENRYGEKDDASSDEGAEGETETREPEIGETPGEITGEKSDAATE